MPENETQFWNEILTEKSWNALQKIKKEFDFILIGGWAVYLWSRALKSKDIDIVIDFKTLDYLKQNYRIKKNDKLKKYEFSLNEVDVDVYVPYYSKLAIPVEDIKNYTKKIEDIKIVKPEILIILKQKAEIKRGEFEKGLKDKIDILTLIMNVNINWKEYYRLLEKYKLEFFLNRLKMIINQFKDIKYLRLNPRQFKLEKKKILDKLKTI